MAHISNTLIDGVQVKDLRMIPDERGRLCEILRADDPMYEKFGQVYYTTAYPGVVKAWHLHDLQDDNTTCVVGMIKFVLYDDRKDSPTRGIINEFYMGEHRPLLVHVPKGVYHGFKCVSETQAVVVNMVTEPYNYENPDEKRLDPHQNDIGYDWSRRDG